MAARTVWEHAWKASRGRADWVVLTNVDEFIWHPAGMGNYLAQCEARGDTIIHPRGYQMVSPTMPAAGALLPDVLRIGAPMFGYDKRQVFKPDAIREIGFQPGRHACNPTGHVVDAHPVEAKLLHYKYVDYDGYFVPRQLALAPRLLPGDISKGYGWQYSVTPAKRREVYDWLLLHATDVVS
jgi:hypothetical protein